MTNPVKTITILSVATTLLLTSCSSKFGSREEARIAATTYRGKECKDVVVSYPAYPHQIKWETEARQESLENECARDRKGMGVKEPVKPHPILGTPKQKRDYNSASIAYSYSQLSKSFVEQNCSPIKKIVLSKEEIEALTKLKKEQTIECNEEKETKQFVCKEWKTDETKMERDEWFSLKPNYSYFRY